MTSDPNAASAASCSHEAIKPTPLYHGGRKVYKCEGCGALLVDDNQEPVTKGLIPLGR